MSQFQRLAEDYDYDPHAFSLSISPSSSAVSYAVRSSPSRRGFSQIWKPSFSFHFAAIRVIQRTWRRIGSFLFKPQSQRLPYFNPTVSTTTPHSQRSFASNKLLTFLSRDDTNIFGHDHHSPSRFVPGFVSFYWNRIWSKKKRGQE
jgi:hypothetical protein